MLTGSLKDQFELLTVLLIVEALIAKVGGVWYFGESLRGYVQ